MNLLDLKSELKKRGFSQKGGKAEPYLRLKEALNKKIPIVGNL